MFEPCFEVISVDDLIFVCVEQFKQLVNFFIHLFVLDYTAFKDRYIETMARNSERLTLS
jgi:hypothetical protein